MVGPAAVAPLSSCDGERVTRLSRSCQSERPRAAISQTASTLAPRTTQTRS